MNTLRRLVVGWTAFTLLTCCGTSSGGGNTGGAGQGGAAGASNALGGAGGAAEVEAQTLSKEGGTLELGGVRITASADALREDVEFTVRSAELPGELPPGVELLGTPVDISVSSDGDPFNAPVQLEFSFGSVEDDLHQDIFVLHHDEERGYEVTTTLDINAERGTITVESASFSEFVVVSMFVEPNEEVDTGFDPMRHGWSIKNFATSYTGGQCGGMSLAAVWSWLSDYDLYSGFEARDEEAYCAALRIQTNATSRLIYLAPNAVVQTDIFRWSKWRTANRLRMVLTLEKRPVCLGMESEDGSTRHAIVAHGYDSSGVYVYDSNRPGESRLIPYSGTALSNYDGYTKFAHVGLPSWFGIRSFIEERLRDDDYTSADTIELDRASETGGAVSVTGTVDGSRLEILAGNGWERLAVRDGEFADSFVAPESNTIVLHRSPALLPGDCLVRSVSTDACPGVPAELEHLCSSLTAAYLLDGSAENAAQAEFDGTTQGTLTPTTNRFGWDSAAMQFDCSESSGVVIADFPQTEPPLTRTAWFRRSAQQPSATYEFVLDTSGSGGFNLHQSGSLEVEIELGTADWKTFPSGNVLDDQWHQAVLTYDGTTARGYLDGELLGEAIDSDPIDYDTTGLHIGRQWTSEYPFCGDIDDVLVFTTALTSDEVAQLYSAGLP